MKGLEIPLCITAIFHMQMVERFNVLMDVLDREVLNQFANFLYADTFRYLVLYVLQYIPLFRPVCAPIHPAISSCVCSDTLLAWPLLSNRMRDSSILKPRQFFLYITYSLQMV